MCFFGGVKEIPSFYAYLFQENSLYDFVSMEKHDYLHFGGLYFFLKPYPIILAQTPLFPSSVY